MCKCACLVYVHHMHRYRYKNAYLYLQYYSTIAEAVEEAPPCGRILVHPGVYNESFVLDRPLSLIGAGPERVLLVSTTQTVIEVAPHVKHVLVSNMEIKVATVDSL